MTTSRRKQQQDVVPTKFDAVISGVALTIVGLMLAFTIVLAVTEPTGPPEFAFGMPQTRILESGQLVEVEISNTGGSAAESFTVVASLPDGSQIEQDGGWLSPGESDHLAYVVGTDVVADEITFEVVAFDAAG